MRYHHRLKLEAIRPHTSPTGEVIEEFRHARDFWAHVKLESSQDDGDTITVTCNPDHTIETGLSAVVFGGKRYAVSEVSSMGRVMTFKASGRKAALAE